MRKVYLRKAYHETMPKGQGPQFSEWLDIQIDQEYESNEERYCAFSFRSQLAGSASISGLVSFSERSLEPSRLSHSSGWISLETMSNFNAFSALLSRLETLCASGLTDEQIFEDDRVRLILKNNNFVERSE